MNSEHLRKSNKATEHTRREAGEEVNAAKTDFDDVHFYSRHAMGVADETRHGHETE